MRPDIEPAFSYFESNPFRRSPPPWHWLIVIGNWLADRVTRNLISVVLSCDKEGV